MSTKLKALSLTLLAALAMSAVAALSASATDDKNAQGQVITGHFVTTNNSIAKIKGEDEPGGKLTEFHAFEQSIVCDTVLPVYHGTSKQETFTEITLTPTYEECRVRSTSDPAHINMKGCTYKVTIRHKDPTTNYSTIHLSCPTGTGPQIIVTGAFGECVMEITPNQTPDKGALYTQLGGGVLHYVRATILTEGIHTVIIKGGFFQCGTAATTTSVGKLTGTVWVDAIDHVSGERVPLTVTGGTT